MTDVILFHHAQGLTDGVREFADQLRIAGHRVTVPDLYGGVTFETLHDGIGHAEQVGFDTIIERGRLAAEGLPTDSVYAGFSLGVLPAQMLAQTRPGAKDALLFHSCVPTSQFGCAWPQGVPLQIHAMEADALFVAEGDLDARPRSRRHERQCGPFRSTPAINTCSPTTACPPTTKVPRCYSSNAWSNSSTTSASRNGFAETVLPAPRSRSEIVGDIL